MGEVGELDFVQNLKENTICRKQGARVALATRLYPSRYASTWIMKLSLKNDNLAPVVHSLGFLRVLGDVLVI